MLLNVILYVTFSSSAQVSHIPHILRCRSVSTSTDSDKTCVLSVQWPIHRKLTTRRRSLWYAVLNVGRCARERCYECRPNTSTSSASHARVSEWMSYAPIQTLSPCYILHVLILLSKMCSCWPWNHILIQKCNPTKMLIQEHVALGKIRFCVAYIGDIQCHEAKCWMKQWCKLESWYVRNIERQNVLIFRKGVVYTGLLLLSIV